MKYIVAVSGGVDSVVLLNTLVSNSEAELIVTHFDHGIREDSAADARFVAGLAKMYGLPFETKRVELGEHASEEAARIARYTFLREMATKHHARIVTAHHHDDVVETVAINIIRGTGWRGLAVLNDPSIERPLLNWTKQIVYEHALKYKLEWVEDATNTSEHYLRNRVRRRLNGLAVKNREKLIGLFVRQRMLASDIDDESKRLNTTSRYLYMMIDDVSASELLRSVLIERGVSLTRPQRLRFLHAIKTATPGSIFEAGNGVSIGFTMRNFIVKHPL